MRAYFDDGFSPKVLLQVVEELRGALPNVIGDLNLKTAWAYKYDSRPANTGIAVHAAPAAVWPRGAGWPRRGRDRGGGDSRALARQSHCRPSGGCPCVRCALGDAASAFIAGLGDFSERTLQCARLPLPSVASSRPPRSP